MFMIEKVIQALTEPKRRVILQLVYENELTSSAIASHFDISAPAISQHLKVLEGAGLVIVRKEGTKRYYGIKKDGFSELKQFIEHFWDDHLLLLKEVAEEEERKIHESESE
ncbi:MAG: metalloregulator ArsR/SmtB family transcription factor [Paenisporosarcina sp.]